MISWKKSLVAAAALCVLSGSSALATPGKANPPGNPNPPGHAYGINGKNVGVPGPIAGAGLPFLLIAGGYALVRRYRRAG